MNVLLVLGCLLLLNENPDTLHLVGPKKAKFVDLKKAGAVVEARCKAFGYDGVTAKVVRLRRKGNVIRLTREEGFTERMIERFQSGLLKNVEYDFEGIEFVYHTKTDAEEDKYDRGVVPKEEFKQLDKWPAPPGVKWKLDKKRPGSLSAYMYYPDATITKDAVFVEVFKPSRDKTSLRLVLNEKGLTKWSTLPERVQRSAIKVIPHPKKQVAVGRWRQVKEDGKDVVYLYIAHDDDAVVCFQNPLPLKLTVEVP